MILKMVNNLIPEKHKRPTGPYVLLDEVEDLIFGVCANTEGDSGIDDRLTTCQEIIDGLTTIKRGLQ